MLFTWLKRYADFAGRSSRKEYWMGILCGVLLGLAGVVIDLLLFSGSEADPAQLVISLATLVPSIALGVRRMHDLDKSGWWVLIGLIPLVGWIIFLVWAVRSGQPTSNRFGAPPPETPGFVGTEAEVFS